MKKLIKAFTLIELLVVVTIITLLSSAGVFYFLDFVQEQEISQKLYLIEDNIESLDKQVKNYDIFDYEMIFNTTNSYFYKTYNNVYDSTKQVLALDNSGSGTILGTLSGTGIIKIYKGNKLYLNDIIDRGSNYDYDLNENQNYKISGTSSGETLNDIYINYYSPDNIRPENNNFLELTSINTLEDKTGTSYNSIKVINVGGLKKFYNGNTEITGINEIYLFFENNGKQKYIKIKK